VARDDDLTTRRGLVVDGGALEWWATRSGGPGGQHANTSDTAVTLELRVADAGLPEAVAERLVAAHGPTVRVSASDSRSQFRNRQLARERLAELVDAAAAPVRPRRPTRPTRGGERRRREAKARRAETKQRRSWRYRDE